jgi:hypothetical protein
MHDMAQALKPIKPGKPLKGMMITSHGFNIFNGSNDLPGPNGSTGYNFFGAVP